VAGFRAITLFPGKILADVVGDRGWFGEMVGSYVSENNGWDCLGAGGRWGGEAKGLF
jgi:hypothetical protein